MCKRTTRFYFSLAAAFLIVGTLALLVSCGSSNTPSTSNNMTGTVTTTITDPPTCAAPMGPFQSVWVTITKVTANISSDAGPNDSGWQTLVDLTSGPKQVDLFTLASPACVLTQLGSATGLPPGNYQQIRLYLLSNSPAAGAAVPSVNNCPSGSYNCVVTSMGTYPLQLSSEVQTGIKIPPGQIQGGAISLQAGQAADVSINFNGCASIVQQGPGMYRLKPTLTAGVVSLNNNAISGTVVGQGGTTGIEGAIVLLEKADGGTPDIDRVQQAAITDSGGHFIFCPLSGGPYDVVVAAKTGSTTVTTYNPTISFSIPVGTDVGNIPLAPEGSPSDPATIEGQVTSTNSGATSADFLLSALQQATPTGGSALQVTIPIFGAMSQPPALETTDSPNPPTPPCKAGTDCYNFSVDVPASNAIVATWDTGSKSITYPTEVPTGDINYNINAWADTCSAGNVTTPSPVAVTAGNTTTLSSTLDLTGCP